jgi:hypothetical protein
VYFVWSCFVFFGSLETRSHEWWPMFLFPLILPWSLLIEWVSAHWIARSIGSASQDVFYRADFVTGIAYIVVGTLWFGILGSAVNRLLLNSRRSDENGPNHRSDPSLASVMSRAGHEPRLP